MPDPKNYESEDKWMSACVPTMEDEGRKHNQAVAACLNMWRNKEVGMEDEVKNKVWEALKGLWPAKKEKNIHPFMVWKEEDEYRWLAVYSNKWRDEDSPPEILASAAHKEFVEAVDKGDWPHPEAWLWHVPGTRFGVADYVAYDDTGFALASGTVDKGKEQVAELLMTKEDLAMSHGMPVKEIERDEEDSTIITRYRTIEISPLPREAAANKYGTAIELIREVKMAIPENKRAFLADILGGEAGLKDLEVFLADKAIELEDLNIQSKEESQEAEQESVEAEGAEEEAEPKEESKEEAEETPKYVTADELAEVFSAYVKPIMDRLDGIDAIEAAIEEQGKSIKTLEKSTEEQVKETIANTPSASLFEHIQSAIGSPETYVDGRTSLAKAGPKETEDEHDGPAKVGIINELMAQSWSQRQ